MASGQKSHEKMTLGAATNNAGGDPNAWGQWQPNVYGPPHANRLAFAGGDLTLPILEWQSRTAEATKACAHLSGSENRKIAAANAPLPLDGFDAPTPHADRMRILAQKIPYVA